MKKIIFILFQTILLTGYSQTGNTVAKAKLEVLVVDSENNPRKGEQILFEGEKNKLVIKGISDEHGQFFVMLPGGDTYKIKIKSVGEAKDYNTIKIPLLEEGEVYGDYKLTLKFELPKIFTLDDLYFDSGKATISPKSFTELNELVEFLTLKPEIKIEVAGHTDNVGDDNNNLLLSQQRADAVKNYLVSKGIAASRLTAKGYGESQPVAPNDTEEGRQQNRRTEVRILEGE